MKKHVAVLMGGLSAEREVSIASGIETVKALIQLGYQVTEIDPGTDLHNQLKAVEPDVVFNALHGTYGEDGIVQGILEMLGIPYTHSGILSSAICMNKLITKVMVESFGILTAPYTILKHQDAIRMAKNATELVPTPYVIKPIQQGSSVGVYIITEKNKAQLEDIMVNQWTFGDEILIEKYIPGAELSTAVVAGKALGTLELKPTSGFYDYHAKYTDGVTVHLYPANIPSEIAELAAKNAELAFNKLHCRTMARIDYRYDNTEGGDGKLYFLELNTHPGFTPLSIVPEIAAHNGMKFSDIVELLIQDAKCEAHAGGK